MTVIDEREELTTRQIDAIASLLYRHLLDESNLPVLTEHLRKRVVYVLSHVPLFTGLEDEDDLH